METNIQTDIDSVSVDNLYVPDPEHHALKKRRLEAETVRLELENSKMQAKIELEVMSECMKLQQEKFEFVQKVRKTTIDKETKARLIDGLFRITNTLTGSTSALKPARPTQEQQTAPELPQSTDVDTTIPDSTPDPIPPQPTEAAPIPPQPTEAAPKETGMPPSWLPMPMMARWLTVLCEHAKVRGNVMIARMSDRIPTWQFFNEYSTWVDNRYGGPAIEKMTDGTSARELRDICFRGYDMPARYKTTWNAGGVHFMKKAYSVDFRELAAHLQHHGLYDYSLCR